MNDPGWRMSWVLVFLMIAVAGASAQEDEPAAEAQPAAPVDLDSIREQTIYVPYSRLRQVFEQEGRGVFVPYEQFQLLWKQAQDALRPKPEPTPPVDALISEIDSLAVVGDQVVQVTATLKLEVLSPGWHQIPLRLADASIQAARIGDQPARLLQLPAGYALLVQQEENQPQMRELVLQYSKAFTKTPGQNRWTLQAPQAPVNRWEIRIPEPGVQVNVQPLVAKTEPELEPAEEPLSAETVLVAFVGAADALQIDWTPRTAGAMGLEALAQVQTQQQVTIDQGVVRTRTELVYQISRAELNRLTIETPADHRVLNVFDANVRSWSVESQENVHQIQIELYEPARETQRVTIELESFRDDLTREGVQVPMVRALDVGRQQGILVIGISAALSVEVTSRSGLFQLDASELPDALATAPQNLAYRFAALPFELSLAVAEVQPEIRARERVEVFLQPERLAVHLLAVYEIDRAGVFQLELDVPPELQERSVRGHAVGNAAAVAVDTFHRSPDDPDRLVINLSNRAIGQVGLLVEWDRRLEDPNLLSPTGQASSIAVPVPRVAPQTVEHSTGRLILYAPESLRIHPDRQQGVQTISIAEALDGIQPTRKGPFSATREVLAYAYSTEAIDLTLNVQRRRPYVTCRQLLSARVEAGVIRYSATFFYQIQYSGVRSLRLDVPADRVEQIRNQTANVAREAPIVPPPEDVQPGYVAWNLTGETEFLGAVTVRFAWESRIGDLDVQRTVYETVPRLVPQGVDLASGQIVLAKAETLDVQPASDPQGLQPIDPTLDLMPAAPAEDAAWAFEFQDDARSRWELVMDITRYDWVPVVRTSIERAVLRTEITRSNELSFQALYRVRSARQRLPLELPANPNFDSDPLRINGRSVPLERGDQGAFFVPLSGVNADEPFLLELRYTVPGTLRRLELPRFGGGDADTQAAVQKIYLCAYLPREWKLLGTLGPWTDEFSSRWYEPSPYARQSDRELVRWVTEGFDVPDPFDSFATDGRLHVFSTVHPAPDSVLRMWAIHQNLLSGMSFLVVLLVGAALIRQPLTRKSAAIALLIGLLLVAGVFAPMLARQILDGAFFTAVILVVVLWSTWYLGRLSKWLSGCCWGRSRASLPNASPPAPERAPPASDADVIPAEVASGDESQDGSEDESKPSQQQGGSDE